MTHHRASGLEAGLTEDQLDNLGQYESSPQFDDTERAVLHYAEQLTENVSVSDEVFADLEQWFSEQEIVELTLSISAANFVNRFNDALEIPLEE